MTAAMSSRGDGALSGVPTACLKTKVAVLIGTLEVGGAELDIVRNYPRLNRDEFDVVVVTFGPAGPLAPELERQGIRVVSRLQARDGDGRHRRSLGAFRRVGRVVAVTWWVARVFRRERIDIAHFFLPHVYAYGMVACALTRPRAKRVMSRLSLNFYGERLRLLSWLERHWLHRRVDIAIGNSAPIISELVEEGVPPDRVRLIHNGIDAAPFARRSEDRAAARDTLGIERDAFVILAVGNLWSHKGHRDLIDACALASMRLPPPWYLLIAGRDQQGNKAAYEELVAQRGLAGNIRILGARDDILELLMAADVFVQPSHHEGLPNAVVEAMAASLPVIGTRVGGIPEAVRTDDAPVGGDSGDSSGSTGWLVPPGEPAELAEALLRAAADPERRRRMGEHGRERVVDEFSLEKSVHAYETIYRELMR